MKKFFILVGILMSAEATSESVPQSCNIALSQIRENYFLLSEKEQFDDYQRRLCDEKFLSFDEFSSRGTELGLDIPLAKGMLGLSGSSDSQKSSFIEKYEKFCELNSATNAAKNRYLSNVSKISDALANNWLKCHELHLNAYIEKYKYGTFIDVVPQDDFREFSVKVARYSKRPDKVVIKSINPGRSVDCFWGRTKIEEGKTEIELNEFTLSCEKHPSRSIQFSIDTQEGASNVVQVPSQTSKLLEMSSKIDSLYQGFVELEESKVLPGTIAFFESQDCPVGWSRAAQLSGKYIVATYEENKDDVGISVGTRLSSKENRPTGNHVHGLTTLDYHRADYAGGGGGVDFSSSEKITTLPKPIKNMSFVDGTNAPYILLSACRKNEK